MITSIIYVITMSLLLVICRKKWKKDILIVNTIIFTIVLTVLISKGVLYELTLLSTSSNTKVLGLVKDVSILLATAYVFIFGLESKKIFGRTVAEYFSIEIDTMYQVFMPMAIFLIVVAIFNPTEMLALSLHLALYNMYMFVNILNEVLRWNKRIIKDKYVEQVIEQFALLPSEPDETTLSNFLTDIDSFKILEDTRFDIDILFRNRINKVYREFDDLTIIREFDDKVTNLLFKKIVNQYIYESRENKLIKTNYPYYINTFIAKLDSYEATQLLYNNKFIIEGLDEIDVIEILLNRVIQLKKHDKHNNILLFLPTVLQFSIQYRKSVSEDELMIKFYSILYENNIDMIECANPKYIDNYLQLKAIAIIEAIIDWNNYRFGNQSDKTKYHKIKIETKLNKCSNNQCLIECSRYIDMIKKDLSVEEIFIHITSINKLYKETIRQIEMRYNVIRWTPYDAKESMITEHYAQKLFDWLRYLYHLDDYNFEDALIFDSLIETYYLIDHINETSENLKRWMNEIFKNKYKHLKEYFHMMSNMDHEFKKFNGIFNTENKKLYINEEEE